MKKRFLFGVVALTVITGFVQNLFAAPPPPGGNCRRECREDRRGDDGRGVRLATDIVNLVGASVNLLSGNRTTTVVAQPAPVAVAPAPVVVAQPAPVVVAQPAPVVVAPAPVVVVPAPVYCPPPKPRPLPGPCPPPHPQPRPCPAPGGHHGGR